MLLLNRTYLKLFVFSCCAIAFTACSDDDPYSASETLPMPPEIEANKDRSVNPGDSFFDYCNGSWLAANPIPTDTDLNLGGLYDCQPVMNQYKAELRKNVPDLRHFYDLVEHI